jgi:hypothetical protein
VKGAVNDIVKLQGALFAALGFWALSRVARAGTVR